MRKDQSNLRDPYTDVLYHTESVPPKDVDKLLHASVDPHFIITKSQYALTNRLESKRTIEEILKQEQKQRLTFQQTILLIIEYLYFMNEPRSENDIRMKILVKHNLRGGDFHRYIEHLCRPDVWVCKRITVGGSHYIILTERGKKYAKLVFDDSFASFLNIMALPTTFTWEKGAHRY